MIIINIICFNSSSLFLSLSFSFLSLINITPQKERIFKIMNEDFTLVQHY